MSKPHYGPMLAQPGRTGKAPRRLMIPAASPVTITRRDGSQEVIDAYKAQEAAQVIRGGQSKKNQRTHKKIPGSR